MCASLLNWGSRMDVEQRLSSHSCRGPTRASLTTGAVESIAAFKCTLELFSEERRQILTKHATSQTTSDSRLSGRSVLTVSHTHLSANSLVPAKPPNSVSSRMSQSFYFPQCSIFRQLPLCACMSCYKQHDVSDE